MLHQVIIHGLGGASQIYGSMIVDNRAAHTAVTVSEVFDYLRFSDSLPALAAEIVEYFTTVTAV